MDKDLAALSAEESATRSRMNAGMSALNQFATNFPAGGDEQAAKLKARIAEILQAEGYIAGWSTQDATVGSELVVTLKYGPERQRSLAGVKRVSKPGLRVYAKSTNLPKVLGGLGVAILSTSSGLLTDKQAAKKGVGGEVLAYVW